MSSETHELKIDCERKPSTTSSVSEREFRRKNLWKTCCGSTINKNAVQFFSQLTISLIVIIFCIFQLHTLDKCDSDVYMSLLTMILGIYVEAPRLNER